jgi:Na+-transporting methylmalonyl-CoA/oxaloacetate decarboxylase gamma subunit
MEHAITVLDVVKFVLIVGGMGVVLAFLVFLLWAFAQGFNH